MLRLSGPWVIWPGHLASEAMGPIPFSRVAPRLGGHCLEHERLLEESRRHLISAVLPDRDVGEMLVVALRFAIGSLILLAKVRPTRFAPLECVPTHELGELVVIREASGPFEGVVQLLTRVRQPDILPERAAQLGDPLERTHKPARVSRHAAVFPQVLPELAKVIVEVRAPRQASSRSSLDFTSRSVSRNAGPSTSSERGPTRASSSEIVFGAMK